MNLISRRAAGLLVCLALTFATAACSSGEPPAQRPKAGASSPFTPAPTALIEQEPAEIQSAAIAAARAAGWVHFVGTAKQEGIALRVVTDVGPDFGVQVLTAEEARIEVRYVKRIAYLRGNRAGLELIGFPDSIAREYADRWISVTEADGGYAELSEALTMESLIASFVLGGDLSKTDVRKIGTRKVIGVTGTQTRGGTGTLFVALEGKPILVRVVGEIEGQRGSVDFSKWGVSFRVDAPANATPVSEIG